MSKYDCYNYAESVIPIMVCFLSVCLFDCVRYDNLPYLVCSICWKAFERQSWYFKGRLVTDSWWPLLKVLIPRCCQKKKNVKKQYFLYALMQTNNTWWVMYIRTSKLVFFYQYLRICSLQILPRLLRSKHWI